MILGSPQQIVVNAPYDYGYVDSPLEVALDLNGFDERYDGDGGFCESDLVIQMMAQGQRFKYDPAI